MPWDFWILFTVLGVLIPWRGSMRLKRLLSQPAGGTKEKLVLYGSTIAFQWLLLGVVLWRALVRGISLPDLGVSNRITPSLALAGVIGALILGALQSFNLRRISRTEGPIVERMRRLAERLLPTRQVEFAPYFALVVTAGVCEEFLYRGFVMAALSQAGLPVSGVVVVSSILFGLAHAYQGRSGVAGTTLLGLSFALFRLIYISLLPLILWHIAFDLAAGIAGPRYLLKGTAVQ